MSFTAGFLIPINADPVQVTEMRKAFYAGGYGLLTMLMSIMSPDAEPVEQDMKKMDAIHDEFLAFAKERQWEATMTTLMEGMVHGKPS